MVMISFVLSQFGNLVERYFSTHVNFMWGIYGGKLHASSSLTERVLYGRIEAKACNGIMGGIMDAYDCYFFLHHSQIKFQDYTGINLIQPPIKWLLAK